MSWFFAYIALGALWAEMGMIGHRKKYKEDITVSLFLFMLVAWPYLVFFWIKEMFK